MKMLDKLFVGALVGPTGILAYFFVTKKVNQENYFLIKCIDIQGHPRTQGPPK